MAAFGGRILYVDGAFVEGDVSSVVSDAVDYFAVGYREQKTFATVDSHILMPFPKGGECLLYGIVASFLVVAAIHGKAEDVVSPEVDGLVVFFLRQDLSLRCFFTIISFQRCKIIHIVKNFCIFVLAWERVFGVQDAVE